jgi:hypothetical protein
MNEQREAAYLAVVKALREISIGKTRDDMDNGWICAARLSGIAREALKLAAEAEKERG